MIARPRPIGVIAWIFIAVGAAGLLRDWVPLLLSDSAQQFAKLKADGLADIGPALTSRLLAIVGGWGLLRGHNWGRWLLLAWMAFHIGLSMLHSLERTLAHVAIFAPLLYFMFRRSSWPYFHSGTPTPT